MKYIILFFLVFGSFSSNEEQTIQSSATTITFFSKAALEDIEAVNKKAKAAIDLSNGQLAYSLYISDFEFDKKLMQKHFQNKYMEVEKYPKSTFSGTIQNWNGVENLSSTSTSFPIKGKMTIHGVEQQINETITLKKVGKTITMSSTFNVELVDYDIKRPKVMFQNIAETIEINVNSSYEIE